MPICIKIGLFVYKIACLQFGNRRTDGRTKVENINGSACQSAGPGGDRTGRNSYGTTCAI